MTNGRNQSVLLAEVPGNEQNSFNLVRLAVAIAVVASPSCALIIGEIAGEPLSGVTPYTLGQHPVNVLFLLCGVRLSRSWAFNSDLWRFVLARLLRTYAALAARGVVVALLLASLWTELPLGFYLTDRDTLL
jgi:hypothetical protein